MRRRASARVTCATVWALALGTAGATSACGGAKPVAKAAPEPAPTATETAEPVSTDAAAVVAVSPGLGAGTDDMPSDAKSAYSKGFQAWVAGDLPGAKAAFTDAASRAPKAGGPRYSLGCVLERLGDSQGALDAYRSAYNASPKYEVAMGAYAVGLARSGHGSDAEQFLADKRAQSPDSARLTTYLAEVKSIEGDSPGCQLLAQQALTKQPGFKDAMVVIARDFYRSHKWDLARYALQAILDGADDGSIPPRDKGNGEALLLRSLIERDSGQRKQALADLALTISRRPDLFEAYVNLGEMKLEAGNATEAQAPLERAIRYAPNVPVAHLDLGDCYRLLGRPADAKKELDTALRMDSTLAGAHYDLGLLYLFSQSVPGATGQDDQIAKAIQELETYRSMRGAKTTKGPGDDVDELLSTAKRKQSELQMKKQAAATAAAAPPPPAAPAAAPKGAPAAAPSGAASASPKGAPAAAPPASSAGAPPKSAPAASAAPAPAPAASGQIVRTLPK
jgi:tetratricopeptide (TPR) repeat protein